MRRLLGRPASLTLLFMASWLALAGCPNPQPGVPSGNLEILFGTTVDFHAVIAQDPACYNQAQLDHAPLAPLSSGVDNVSYSDNFSSNASQTEIIVMARDPDEQEATLESLSELTLDDVANWLTQTQGPGDPQGLVHAVTLPNAVSIPFPVNGELCTPRLGCFPLVPQTDWPLSRAQFTGGPGFQLGGNAAEPPGPKGAYLLQRGVCAYDVDLQSAVVDQMTMTIPSKVIAGIEHSFLGNFTNEVTANVGASSFLNRNNAAEPFGGIVSEVMLEVDYPYNAGGPAYIVLNETYTFGLNNGVLSVAPTRNGENDTGLLSGNIASALTSDLPTQVANTVYTQALATQAQPIPAVPPSSPDGGFGAPPPECQGTGNKPSHCFQICNPDSLPSPFPPKLDASNTDDSSWYNTSYCGSAVTTIHLAAIKGATTYPLQEPGISAVPDLLQAQTPDRNSYLNVRCNFYPTYETDANAVPVCEVVPRAKRLNVMPDAVELVWFDGPDLEHIGSSEYGNEAFALFLALRGAQSSTSALCNRTEESNVLIRRFAHGLGYSVTR